MGIAKFFLAVGIAIIFAVFISYGLSVVYEFPESSSSSRDNSCYTTYNCQDQIESCQNQYNSSDSRRGECYSSVSQSSAYKSCQENYRDCQLEAEKKSPRYIYARNKFYILMVIGITSIITGIFMTGLEGIGSGLIGGGILLVLYSLFATLQYWATLNKYFKLGAIGVVLVVLIFFGYKKIEKKFGSDKN